MPEINVLGHESLKKIRQILVDNNLTYLLKNKNVYRRRKKTL